MFDFGGTTSVTVLFNGGRCVIVNWWLVSTKLSWRSERLFEEQGFSGAVISISLCGLLYIMYYVFSYVTVRVLLRRFLLTIQLRLKLTFLLLLK